MSEIYYMSYGDVASKYHKTADTADAELHSFWWSISDRSDKSEILKFVCEQIVDDMYICTNEKTGYKMTINIYWLYKKTPLFDEEVFTM